VVPGLGVASVKAILFAVALWGAVVPAVAADGWQQLAPGLELTHFDSRHRVFADDGDLTVLRVETRLHPLVLLAGGESRRSLAQWCDEFDLLAATNAGMYQADLRTHVGFCQVRGEVVNGFANDYLSALALDPLDPADPPFRIIDLDVMPLAEIRQQYATVVQNLRLIKGGGENRWQPALDQWPEAALAQDNQGRALLVYCRMPWSMYQFNEILLALPLGVVAAQHLEGRSQAGLYMSHLADEKSPAARAAGPVLPNVIGVSAR